MSEFWGKAKEVLGVVAPAIGTALGGPLGGVAARTVASVLLGKEDASEAEIASAIVNATPDQLLALKKADHDFRTRLKELDVDLERIAAEDRDSARKRQMEMRDRMPGLLAAMVFTGFFGILGALLFVTVPEAASDPLNIMLGSLGTLVVQIAAYYFGSSSGSAAKQKMLDRVIGSSPAEGR